MYNLTNISTSTSLLQFYVGVDQLVEGWFTLIILMSVFIISFIMFKGYDTVTALRSSSFMTSILAILFFILELIDQTYLMIIIVMTGLLVAYDVMKKE